MIQIFLSKYHIAGLETINADHADQCDDSNSDLMSQIRPYVIRTLQTYYNQILLSVYFMQAGHERVQE